MSFRFHGRLGSQNAVRTVVVLEAWMYEVGMVLSSSRSSPAMAHRTCTLALSTLATSILRFCVVINIFAAGSIFSTVESGRGPRERRRVTHL